jgi:tripartite-type tricarboxylate transporter receptor subunit TctC
MLRRRSDTLIFSLCLTLGCVAPASSQTALTRSGQDYPNKPIRVVTGEPGGATNFSARFIAQGIAGGLGQNIIVENRPSRLLGEYVARALPDGYTLLIAGGTFVMGPLLQTMPYDVERDFAPVSLATTSPSVLLVHPSVQVKSVKELIALAKAKPGGLNYASGGSGAASHLAAELFKSMANVDLVRINFKGNGPALNALMAGEVQMIFVSASAVAPHIKSGKLHALAVISAEPSALAPGLPTVAASGLPGYESASSQGVWVPARTSAAIINRVHQEVVRFLARPDAKEKLFSAGSEVVASSPEQFAKAIRTELVRMGKVIKDAGIKVD